jgi:hypothetical protein
MYIIRHCFISYSLFGYSLARTDVLTTVSDTRTEHCHCTWRAARHDLPSNGTRLYTYFICIYKKRQHWNLLKSKKLAKYFIIVFWYGIKYSYLYLKSNRNQCDNSVYYETLSFSRPQHLLSKVGYPVAR